MKDFHRRYKKISPWWKFIRQEFELTENHHRQTVIYDNPFSNHKVELRKNGLLTVKAGFDFGASGPTIDTKSSREASCVHDAIYYLSDRGLFEGEDSRKMRGIADKLLYEICIENKMWKYRAKSWLKTLELFGGYAWQSGVD